MTRLRPLLRSLIPLVALALMPGALPAQGRPAQEPGRRPSVERQGPERRDSRADRDRPDRGRPRDEARDNPGRPPARSTGEPELRRRKP